MAGRFCLWYSSSVVLDPRRAVPTAAHLAVRCIAPLQSAVLINRLSIVSRKGTGVFMSKTEAERFASGLDSSCHFLRSRGLRFSALKHQKF